MSLLAEIERVLRVARDGKFRCPGCGELRPPLTDDQAAWWFFCEACRDEPKSSPAANGDG